MPLEVATPNKFGVFYRLIGLCDQFHQLILDLHTTLECEVLGKE